MKFGHGAARCTESGCPSTLRSCGTISTAKTRCIYKPVVNSVADLDRLRPLCCKGGGRDRFHRAHTVRPSSFGDGRDSKRTLHDFSAEGVSAAALRQPRSVLERKCRTRRRRRSGVRLHSAGSSEQRLPPELVGSVRLTSGLAAPYLYSMRVLGRRMRRLTANFNMPAASAHFPNMINAP